MKFDVLITGGGFAGVYCAKAVAKAMGHDSQHRIGLVADQNIMVFQPLLAEVAGAALSPLDVVSPLREMCPGVNVLLGGIREVDIVNRRVILDAGYFTSNICIEYGHLVLALGGVVDLSRVPGMTEHGFVLKNVGDALRLRQTVISRLEEANVAGDADTSQRLLTFAIVGGGYSGVETAGQLLDLVQDVKPLYHNLANRPIRVVLVHSGPFLLPDIGEKLGAYAANQLQKRGSARSPPAGYFFKMAGLLTVTPSFQPSETRLILCWPGYVRRMHWTPSRDGS
jgi:NADH dehydrogenase